MELETSRPVIILASVLNSSAAAWYEINAPQRAREASRKQRIMSTSSRRLTGDR
jgi:hypothetical protein